MVYLPRTACHAKHEHAALPPCPQAVRYFTTSCKSKYFTLNIKKKNFLAGACVMWHVHYPRIVRMLSSPYRFLGVFLNAVSFGSPSPYCLSKRGRRAFPPCRSRCCAGLPPPCLPHKPLATMPIIIPSKEESGGGGGGTFEPNIYH